MPGAGRLDDINCAVAGGGDGDVDCVFEADEGGGAAEFNFS